MAHRTRTRPWHTGTLNQRQSANAQQLQVTQAPGLFQTALAAVIATLLQCRVVNLRGFEHALQAHIGVRTRPSSQGFFRLQPFQPGTGFGILQYLKNLHFHVFHSTLAVRNGKLWVKAGKMNQANLVGALPGEPILDMATVCC
ncbi:hypothetical protein D9M71_289340 [compost metagenome]